LKLFIEDIGAGKGVPGELLKIFPRKELGKLFPGQSADETFPHGGAVEFFGVTDVGVGGQGFGTLFPIDEDAHVTGTDCQVGVLPYPIHQFPKEGPGQVGQLFLNPQSPRQGVYSVTQNISLSPLLLPNQIMPGQGGKKPEYGTSVYIQNRG
jgi:hypothetical protein